MNGKFYLLFLINIPLAAVMIIVEFLNGYGLGYFTSASANPVDSWILYAIYLGANLLINLGLHFLLKAVRRFSLIVTSLEILFIYGFMAGIYAGY